MRPHDWAVAIDLRESNRHWKLRLGAKYGSHHLHVTEELAPYYDKVESYIGVFGTKENVSSAPTAFFLPPPKPRCTELMVKKACDKLNIICIPSRLAVIRVRSTAACPATTAASAAAAASRHQTSAPARFCFPPR